MDAKPQRIRVRTDENAPLALPGKTIHQRNKSTPALSALAQTAGLKTGMRRAAFGDVSNTTNPVRSARDDSALAGKNLPVVPEKGGVVIQEKKPTVLSQPAHRPLSVAGIKGILNNVGHSRSSDISGRQSSQPTANARKLLTKRSNAVFKDPVPSLPATKETVEVSTEEVKEDNPSQNIAPSQKEDTKDSETSETHVELSSDVEAPEKYSAVRSDGLIIDEEAEVKIYGDACGVQESKGTKNDAARTASVDVGDQDIAIPVSKIPNDSINLAHARYEHGPANSEPEEYWDDEDDENEEDDGYVTARSYRSRGDNTTGGATTVLFPKYNQKVKREIAMAKQIVEATRTQEDIDDEDWDTSMVAEYGDEIFEYMREMEIKMLPNAYYMDNQAEIQWSMRSVLMDWLVQVHHRFSLLPETLFLCVNYIDRFLSCKIVSLGKLQLVGATAIFIAAKYEEINCPSVQEIVYMVDGGYTIDEILKAERFMLSMLQFELGWPGPMSFLRRISKADDYDLETRTLAKYFLEITIMDERFVGSPPSFAAAGAHCLARMMLQKGTWTPAHVYYSNYTYSQLYPLVSLILECCENPQKHHSAVFEKYTDKRFKRASLFVEAEMKKGFRLPETPKDSSAVSSAATADYGYSWKRR
ncbi:hypothetical protein DTO164E3_5123 [Paecilomyces variotii]|nr:hypothetical protein DTO164E3_5123 [Paecilomyces variotii]KAJ9200839.1 hypothetical protein DTO032I3_4313 [Paecilomyces variotii]KAJ9231704.1 hypothetical protein DTO169E5_7863 [Paecilomyces variotii]KAJ9250723.1 hypothetical protein DTO207G8_5908 [Paecilomyces variotii]KAJ9278505.1 hypothetical protein DTO021D3_4703 [Paecilomyces variotii]